MTNEFVPVENLNTYNEIIKHFNFKNYDSNQRFIPVWWQDSLGEYFQIPRHPMYLKQDAANREETGGRAPNGVLDPPVVQYEHRRFYKDCLDCLFAFHYRLSYKKDQFAPYHNYSTFCGGKKQPHCTCDWCW